jgi:hypothetical protein
MIALKVVRVKEQEDATAGLAADGRGFLFVLRLGEEEAAFPGTRSPEENPSFSMIERRVFNHLKPQALGVKLKGFVVVPDEE